MLLILVWGGVHYIMRPLGSVILTAKKALTPSKKDALPLVDHLTNFLDALIDALHERVYSSKRIEKELANITQTLKGNSGE